MQLTGSRAEEEVVEGQVREGRERVEQLERELRDVRREAASLRGQLAATEQVERYTEKIANCNPISKNANT